jgi:hypothetical protein
VKKAISIGVALALLTMVLVPVAVSAQPETYAKTPFYILGSGISMVGDLINAMGPTITDQLPFDISAVTGVVGPWVSGDFAYLTDMTGWMFVAVGDVVSAVNSLAATLGFGDYTKPIADVAYVLGARMSDAWGVLTTAIGTAELPAPGIGLPIG